MRLTRRLFLLGPALGWAACRVPSSHSGPVLAETPLAPSSPVDSILRAYVDVLVPADETPSATALGVDKRLLAFAREHPDYQRLLELGLAWFDRQARTKHGRGFPELREDEREAVVRTAAAADADTLPRVFFERTRAHALFHYYGRPESWRGIRQYRGPPQPAGFMDYARPPRSTR